MVALRRLLPFVLSFSRLTRAEDDLPAWFEPPPGSDPITWGFYGTHEMREPTQLKVEGYFPHWLTGSLYRGGAGIWDVGNYTAEHWFDGFSRNHRFEIANGMVSYRSRNGSDEIMDFVRETGRYPEKSFGSDPCKMIFGAFETTFRDGISPHGNKSSMNIAVSYVSNFPGIIGNSTDGNVPFKILVSTTDANGLQQIDPDTLEPTEIFTYQASHALLVNGSQSAAHPVHTADGSLYNYVLDLSSSPPIYRVFGIHPASGETQLLANITDAPPAYIHSLFGTEKHIVLIIWQADFTQEANNIVDSIGPWDPERRALFYVINRANGGIVGKYEAPDAFFAFHQINSFEDKAGNIFVDLPRMNDTSFLSAARIPNLRANLGTPNATSKKMTWLDLLRVTGYHDCASFPKAVTARWKPLQPESSSRSHMGKPTLSFPASIPQGMVNPTDSRTGSTFRKPVTLRTQLLKLIPKRDGGRFGRQRQSIYRQSQSSSQSPTLPLRMMESC